MNYALPPKLQTIAVISFNNFCKREESLAKGRLGRGDSGGDVPFSERLRTLCSAPGGGGTSRRFPAGRLADDATPARGPARAGSSSCGHWGLRPACSRTALCSLESWAAGKERERKWVM